jgi:hypothetical protein
MPCIYIKIIMAYVYKHIRNDTNEIFYIGIGDDKNYDRAYQKKSRNLFWKHIINKTSYSVEIIEDNLSWENACLKEIEYIKKFGRRDLGTGLLVNLTDGGEGLHNPAISVRNQIRSHFFGKTRIEIYGFEKAKEITNIILKNTGKKRNNEFKESQRVKVLGEKNPMYGKSHTNEFKQERREYLLKNNPGKNKTEITKKNISESKIGVPNKYKGIPRKKITCPHCGKIGGEGLMNRWHFENCKHKK